ERRGRRLADGLVEAAAATGIQACWSGIGALFQLWFAPAPPTDYRTGHGIVQGSPFASLRRAAGARRPDPAAAGGPLLRLRRPHRRRHRPHARGGGRDHARGGRGDRARRRRPDRRRAVSSAALAAVLATVLVAAGCGGSGSGGSGSSGSAGTPVNGGTLRAG